MAHHWHSATASARPEVRVPTYQYACKACEHRLEAVQSFSDDPLTVCPECEGRLRKVFSSVGVVFKGSGFYRTDSRAGAKTGSEEGAAKSGPAGGTKTDSAGGSGSSGRSSDSGSGNGRGSATDSASGSSSASPAASSGSVKGSGSSGSASPSNRAKAS